jgi:tRNA nucleotidyltransferase (CCA-adding enzyme)
LTFTVIDPLAGAKDLKAKKLAPCATNSIVLDPLRILRAMALIARRAYAATETLLAQVAKNWPRLKSVPRDRFWPEWARWSKARWPHFGLYFLRDSQALNFFPDLKALIGSPQNPRFHPEGDVFCHTVLVVQALSELDLPDPKRRGLLTLAALLHDIGKPLVVRIDERGLALTKGHAPAGEPVAKAFLRAQRAPRKVAAVVAKLVRWHMELSFKPLTAEGLWRVARKLAPESDLADFWAISAADWNGRRPRFEAFPYSLNEFLAPVGGDKDAPKPLLAGHELIKYCRVAPGPQVGLILKSLAAAHDKGEIRTPEEARRWVRGRWRDGRFQAT